MVNANPKDKRLKEIADKSRFWDVDDLMRNFDREMAQLEQGLGHMVWDTQEHRVTTFLRPLPITPRFQVFEDDKKFGLKVTLPRVSKEDIRLNVDKSSAELFACSGDSVCRPYYVSVVANGELDPETAEAKLTGDVFEVSISKGKKKRLKIK